MTTAPSGVWHLDVRAQRGLGDRDRDLAVQVLALPPVQRDAARRARRGRSRRARPRAGPRSRRPARRMRLPSSTPGRELDVHPVALHRRGPRRAQRAQVRALSEPDPPHSPQRRLKIMRPRCERTCPVPAQSGQATGPMARLPLPVAGLAAVEADDVQAAPRRVEGLVEGDADRLLEVLAAVRAFARRPRAWPPRTPAKMSWKPALPTRTSAEKSKPSNPISGTADSRRPRSPRGRRRRGAGRRRAPRRLPTPRGSGWRRRDRPGLRSGWSWRAAFWNARRISATLALRRTPRAGRGPSPSAARAHFFLSTTSASITSSPPDASRRRRRRRRAGPGAARVGPGPGAVADFWYSSLGQLVRGLGELLGRAARCAPCRPPRTAFFAASMACRTGAVSVLGELVLVLVERLLGRVDEGVRLVAGLHLLAARACPRRSATPPRAPSSRPRPWPGRRRR